MNQTGGATKKKVLPVQPLDQKDVIVLCIIDVCDKSGRHCPDLHRTQLACIRLGPRPVKRDSR